MRASQASLPIAKVPMGRVRFARSRLFEREVGMEALTGLGILFAGLGVFFAGCGVLWFITLWRERNPTS
jgi:hypothetical protein